MLAPYIRFMLLLELIAYVAIAEWLHFLFGWGYAPLALGAIAAALVGRFAMVCLTTAIGFAARSPVALEHRVGGGGAAARLIREWRSVLSTNLVWFPWERFAVRPDPEPGPGGGIPIILAHGYFSNRGYFGALVRALEADGASPVFTPNLSAAFTTIEAYAEELHREIERIASGTAAPQVILICHSMGGLGARAYLCARGAARVVKLITIASPHAGTVHARFGGGPNARQMHRGSQFLKELCEKEGDKGPACGVTSIYSPHDNLVAPQETSRLPWAKNIAIPGRGHIDILSAPELIRIVLEEARECR
jgi:pimeloyl-ACP methyl ester carboxylesterase